jgi:hypothetical protein
MPCHSHTHMHRYKHRHVHRSRAYRARAHGHALARSWCSLVCVGSREENAGRVVPRGSSLQHEPGIMEDWANSWSTLSQNAATAATSTTTACKPLGRCAASAARILGPMIFFQADRMHHKSILKSHLPRGYLSRHLSLEPYSTL